MTTVLPAADPPAATNGRPPAAGTDQRPGSGPGGIDRPLDPDAPAGPDQPAFAGAGADPAPGRGPGGVARIRIARSELRRQLREQKRVRAMALAVVVLVVLGAPMAYFGIAFATRDPVLNSLDRLDVPAWAARQPEDRIIGGSRWCFIDCRFRVRTLFSERSAEETTAVYQEALVEAGWTRWQVEGCPQTEVDGDYSCWTRDEYTLDLWVHPPECAYDPLNLRPDIEAEPPPEDESSDPSDPPPTPEPADDCTGSVVEIKMQNRVADERGLPGSGGGVPPPATGSPAPTSPAPATESPEPAE